MKTIVGGVGALSGAVQHRLQEEIARSSRSPESSSTGSRRYRLSGEHWTEITSSAMHAAQLKIRELGLPSETVDTWMQEFCHMLGQD